MHKKISVGAALTIAIITIIVTAVITTAVTMNIYSGLIADLPEREKMYDSLAEVDNIIRSNYIGDPGQKAINSGLASGYTASLTVGLNYTMTAEEYSEYKIRQSGTDKTGAAIPTVEYKKFGSAGYVRISDFTANTASEFAAAYKILKDNAVTGLIIDVRNNNSINIASAAAVIDKIVPLASEGIQAIAAAIDKNGSNLEIFSADSESIDLPVSVIVNENTSGAGELLACDIRDFGKGTVVGKTTAGNGMYQKVFELSDGGAVVLTVAKLMPYTSDNYDGVGIIPDYESELAQQTDDLNSDTQFLQAYASVTTMRN